MRNTYLHDQARAIQMALASGNVAAAERGMRELSKAAPASEIAGFFGACYLALGKSEEALRYLEAAPPNPENLSLMAVAHIRLKNYSQAIEAATHCLKREPTNKIAIEALQHAALRFDAATVRSEVSSNTLIEPMPFTRLREGNLKNGFRLLAKMYEKHPGQPGSLSMNWSGRIVPRWNGKRVKHLMVVGGQGHGDSLQFVRWCFEVERHVDRLSVVVAPELVELLRRSGINAHPLEAEPMILATADAQTEVILLPNSLSTLSYGPAASYLKAERTRGDDGQFRVGVCWAASKDDRSAPVETLEPLRQVAGVKFYSLGYRMEAPDWMEPMHARNFAEVADLMADLDLVISVDTATAHLAGALGRPTWVALTDLADWRWMDGDTTPWYTTARLFRGGWSAVFETMAETLAKEL